MDAITFIQAAIDAQAQCYHYSKTPLVSPNYKKHSVLAHRRSRQYGTFADKAIELTEALMTRVQKLEAELQECQDRDCDDEGDMI